MVYSLSFLARKKFARSADFYADNFYRNDFFQSKFFRVSGASFILGGIFLLNACGGSPRTSSSAVPTSSATGSLSVSSTLPAGTEGSSYKATLAVTGGTAPYVFSTAAGTLPAGVSLAGSTGTISGTPTASGSFSFSISVVDAKGDSKEQGLRMTVAAAAAPPTSNPPASNPPASNPPASNPPAQSSGTTFSNVQKSGGWGQFGQGPPKFVDCSPSPCDGISFWMAQGVVSPSMSGDAAEFNVGGSTPYSDALWNNHLIGPGSSQGMPDGDRSVVPSLHNFTYDVYFYGDNLGLAQALEFDINQFFGNMGFIFGHECRIAGGNEWDVFDNQKGKWTPTGIPCHPKSNSWNHLTIKVQRTSNNDLVYQSITLNGQTSTLNWTFGHGSTQGWYGVTLNYQMDGNTSQDSYTVYLDNLSFTYE